MIAILDQEERARLFQEELFAPFNLAVWGQRWGGMDAMAVVAMMGFVLPEQLDETPDALETLEAAQAWAVAQQSLNEGAARFAPYAPQIGLAATNVGIYLTDPAKANPINKGYSGMGGYSGRDFPDV